MRKTKLTIQSLAGQGYHVFCKGKVNGKPVRILIDSGASKSVLSRKFADTLGELNKVEVEDNLTSGIGSDPVNAEFVQLDELEVGGIRVQDLIVGLIDVSHVEDLYSSLEIEPFDFILGGDFLKDTRSVIDYRKKELRMTRPVTTE